jgi:hypothetical protein
LVALLAVNAFVLARVGPSFGTVPAHGKARSHAGFFAFFLTLILLDALGLLQEFYFFVQSASFVSSFIQ